MKNNQIHTHTKNHTGFYSGVHVHTYHRSVYKKSHRLQEVHRPNQYKFFSEVNQQKEVNVNLLQTAWHHSLHLCCFTPLPYLVSTDLCICKSVPTSSLRRCLLLQLQTLLPLKKFLLHGGRHSTGPHSQSVCFIKRKRKTQCLINHCNWDKGRKTQHVRRDKK